MPVEAAVANVIASWDDGRVAKGEVVARLTDLLTATNVAEVVAAVPPEWRAPFVDHLRAIAAEGSLVRIVGGIYSYELEGDAARRAEMMAAIAGQRAAEDARFEAIIRPAIREWVRRQG